jgi:hypothetical protein
LSYVTRGELVQAATHAAVEVGDIAVALRRDERADALDKAVEMALAPGRAGGRVDGTLGLETYWKHQASPAARST